MATHQLDDSLIFPPQDERYLNYYFHKMANDSGVNIRMLGPSYLYPFNNKGFPEHVANFSRPIIVHGTAIASGFVSAGASYAPGGASHASR